MLATAPSYLPTLKSHHDPALEAIRREEVEAIKRAMGDKLMILTHHYQRPEIVQMGHRRGDSYILAKWAAEEEKAKHIIFCGVQFMAEGAAVMARAGQRVHHPNLEAGCPMADMVDMDNATLAFEHIVRVRGNARLRPLAYMNTSAEVKAFCGDRGGLVCTSGNAVKALTAGLADDHAVIFFPDEHLARNTAPKVGLRAEEVVLYDRTKADGGLTDAQIRHAKLFLWKGYCHVHTHYRPAHLADARVKWPGVKIVVHPECPEEVVQAADANGSTEFIVRYVKDAGPGSTVAIGTEVNLTARLQMEFPDRHVVPLARSLCGNMFKIDTSALLRTLQGLPDVNVIDVAPEIRGGARKALQRMLDLVG